MLFLVGCISFAVGVATLQIEGSQILTLAYGIDMRPAIFEALSKERVMPQERLLRILKRMLAALSPSSELPLLYAGELRLKK